eukprot:scaffold556_cov58-Cyclotella_meneghiniana.AAC.1
MRWGGRGAATSLNLNSSSRGRGAAPQTLHTFLCMKNEMGGSGGCNIPESEFFKQRAGCSAPEFLR